MAAHDNIDSLDSPGQLGIFPIAKMTQKDDQIGFGFKFFDHGLCYFDRWLNVQSLSPGIGRIGKEIGRKKAKNSNAKTFDFFYYRRLEKSFSRCLIEKVGRQKWEVGFL